MARHTEEGDDIDLMDTDGEEEEEEEVEEEGYGDEEDELRQMVDDTEQPPDSEAEGEDDEDDLTGRTAQERKKTALHQPISSICSALGGYEEFKDANGEIFTEYSLGDQVVGCLKDLKRFWRMDEKDDDRTVARIFHEVGVLKNDLIPILLITLGTGAKGDRIALACVELIGAMTWPINVAEELRDAQLNDELKRSIDYNTLISAQLSYKAVILRTGAIRYMFQLMSPALSKDRRHRTAKDENIISLVLHVIRNLAALKDRPSVSNSSDAIEQSTLQSEYIQQLYDEQIFEFLIAVAQNAESTEFAPWNMIALDIFHLIFRSVKPVELMIPSNKIDENRLKDLLDLEGKQKRCDLNSNATRHSRFGTTLAVKANGRQFILHKQSTLAVGIEKSLDNVKKRRSMARARKEDDLAPPSHLRADAIRCLHEVAIMFLDSAFNPFFASILKDIRMERLKVQASDTIRFLFLARFFLEFFLLVSKDENENGIDPNSEQGHGFDLIAEMTEPMAIGFVTTRIKMAFEDKPVQWTNLHASVDCFIQMLLVIDGLAHSGIEHNVDVAEILQNKLYYEAETLDHVHKIVTTYNNQPIQYLNSVINLTYVLLRMLEKYSKSKAYMYVRKKRSRVKNKNKKKKPVAPGEEEGDGVGQGDEEEEEVDRNTLTYGEHAFEFERFEQRFADEAVLATYIKFLQGYKDLDSEQIKKIVSLLHRQAIKSKSEALFFKPTVLELFNRILRSPDVRRSDGPTSDLSRLIEYILKKFFKVVKENKLLLLEIFLPKSHSQLNRMRDGDLKDPYASAAESDEEGAFGNSLKISEEVEVQPGFSLTQQIGIAIACLVDDDNLLLVEFIKEQLALASAARHEIVLRTDGDPTARSDEESDSDEAMRRKASRLLGPSNEAKALFDRHSLTFSTESTQLASTSNSHFKLLMRLLKWESAPVEDSADLCWNIPATIAPSVLDGDIKIIDNFLLDPVDPNGKKASDLLRKQRKKPVRATRRQATPNSEDEDEEAPRARQKKAKEEMKAYKSAQFIEDSDDDDDPERYTAFFAAEAALRAKLASGQLVATLSAGTKITKSQGDPSMTTTSKEARVAAKAAEKAAKLARKTKREGYVAAPISDVSESEPEEDVDKNGDSDSGVLPASAPAPPGNESSTEQQNSSESSSLPRSRKRSLSNTSVSSSDEKPVPNADANGFKISQQSIAESPTPKLIFKRRAIIASDSEDD